MTQENDQWKRRYILWQLAGIPGDPDNTAQTDRTGGITQLPDPETLKKNNMVHKPLLGPGLPSFVETYIWWATAPADEHFPPRKELEAWITIVDVFTLVIQRKKQDSYLDVCKKTH